MGDGKKVKVSYKTSPDPDLSNPDSPRGAFVETASPARLPPTRLPPARLPRPQEPLLQYLRSPALRAEGRGGAGSNCSETSLKCWAGFKRRERRGGRAAEPSASPAGQGVWARWAAAPERSALTRSKTRCLRVGDWGG